MHCQAIGGNIMTASPISDLNPVFMAVGSKLTLMSKGKIKDYFSVFIFEDQRLTGYMHVLLRANIVYDEKIDCAQLLCAWFYKLYKYIYICILLFFIIPFYG